MHFVLAFLLIFGLALGIGIENSTQLAAISPCVASSITALDNGVCATSDKASPASRAGLRAGDEVTAFNGKPVSTYDQLSTAISQASPGSKASITVSRDGKTLTLHTTLASVPGRSGAYLGIVETTFQSAGPLRAVTYAGSAFGQVVTGSVQAVGALPAALPKLFDKNRADTAAGQVTSIVGAARDTGSAVAANVGWQYKVSFVLLLIASLNIFVGLFNMLPLLPLDGGHVAAIIWERIRAWYARLRKRPDPGLVDMAKLLPVSFSIFAVVMIFGVALILADIVNPVNIAG
jgi:membrane-associated protease RseP (regulator of RpoE activity)